MNKLKIVLFVLPNRHNLLGERCESTCIDSELAIYTHNNTKLNHKNIQNNLKIPNFNLFKTCFTLKLVQKNQIKNTRLSNDSGQKRRPENND